MQIISHNTTLNVPLKESSRFLSQKTIYSRLTPPWARYKMFNIGDMSCSMKKGPFYHFNHRFKVAALDDHTTILTQIIEYQTPFPFLNRWLTKEADRIIAYQSSIITNDLFHIKQHQSPSLKILISGGSGFIGSHIKNFLHLCNHEIYELTRKQTEDTHLIFWNIEKKLIDEKKLREIDVVIHLTGENIAGYWSKKKKKAIYDSRINSTLFLADTLKKHHIHPSLCICASADGIYGLHNHEENTETSPTGSDFLAIVCRDWEETSKKISAKRLINSRFSMVLGLSGGALSKLIPLFKMGLGAILGSGKQSVSWIYIDDLVYQLHHMICDASLSGPINVCSPFYVDNKTFSKLIAKTLHRPLLFRIPAFFLILLFGKLAKSLLLCDKKVIPKKLLDAKAIFSHPRLETCLPFMLGKENIDDMQKKSDL